MATAATVAHEQRASLGHQAIFGAVLLQPFLKVWSRHRDDLAGHFGVVGAAEPGTEQMIGAWLVHAEPQCLVAVRQYIVLDAKRRDGEVVNYVLGRHHELHGSAHGQVDGIDLALAAVVLGLPHPLFGDDVDS